MSLVSLSGPVGAIFSFAIPGIIIGGQEQQKGLDRSTLEKKASIYLAVQTVPAILVALATLFLFRNPKTIDNQHDEESLEDAKKPKHTHSTWKDIKEIFSYKVTYWLLINYGISYGSLIAFGSLVTAVVTSFEGEESIGKKLAIISIIGGFIGSIIYSKTILHRQYQIISLTIFNFLGGLFIAVYSYASYLKLNEIYLYICVGLFGAVVVYIVPIVFEEFVRTVPKHTLLTTSILIRSSGAIFNSAAVLVISKYLDVKTREKGLIACLFFAVAFVIVGLFDIIGIFVIGKGEPANAKQKSLKISLKLSEETS